MASGVIKQITGISAPGDGNYVLIVTATFEAQGSSGGDWGSAYQAKLRMTQNSITTNGDSIPLSSSRLPYAMQYQFAPVSGYSITCDLYCDISGAVAASFYNIKLQAELIKR